MIQKVCNEEDIQKCMFPLSLYILKSPYFDSKINTNDFPNRDIRDKQYFAVDTLKF